MLITANGIMLTNLIPVVYAATDVTSQIGSAITNVSNIIKGVANPIAILALIVMGIYMVMASDPQNIKKVKSWAIALVLGLILINLAGPIVEYISTIGA